MAFSFPVLRCLLPLSIVLVLLAGCVTVKKAQFVDQNFQEAKIRKIDILPVTFEARYAPPYEIDLDDELRSRVKTVLEEKGYEVTLLGGTGAGPEVESRQIASLGTSGADAVLAIHVDFLFISENYNEINPPPAIDIEALGRLVVRITGRELWRDRGIGKTGGSGGQRIRRPVSERFLALTLLAESLLATLPEAQAK